VQETTSSSFSLITQLFDSKAINPLENKFVKALEHFSLLPFSKLIFNETILIIFSISQHLESFAAHPLRITALNSTAHLMPLLREMLYYMINIKPIVSAVACKELKPFISVIIT
jgi:hypothetical protein